MQEYEKRLGDSEICNNIAGIYKLANITIVDNGEFLCMVNGDEIRETGFTSYNLNIFLNLICPRIDS